MREYDLYLPTSRNDGGAIDPQLVESLKASLRETFGGVTHFQQSNEGQWKLGGYVFKDSITILRVLAERNEARTFFKGLKKRLIKDLDQEDILITERRVRLL